MVNVIDLVKMTEEHLPYWYHWVEVRHVKNTWFLDGYEPPEYILLKLKGNGYDYPFIILLNGEPIGYLSCCDLYAYKTLCYEKAGFVIDHVENDGVNECCIMNYPFAQEAFRG